MPAPKSSYNLWIADKPFAIDWPTYTYKEDADPGFNAHLTHCTPHARGRCRPNGLPFEPATGLGKDGHRLRLRRIGEQTVAAARATIKQMVVHLDGCANAEMCWNVLHNERGLSCHFILDNDGTIYQTCDLIACAYHAAGLNETSIGIEICNRGDAKKYPGFYVGAPRELQREVVTCEVNGHKYIAYDYTAKQYEAMEALGKALAKLLPGIRLDYPQASPGVQRWGTMAPEDLRGFAGYLGHYHITPQKWDPGPFDFKRFIGKIGGRRSFPIGLHGRADRARQALPDVPRDGDAEARKSYDKAFDAYYDNNELDGNGGFYPVGPLDHAQLYHGGVHLHPDPTTQPVVAPLAGKVVLARNGPLTDPEIGSTSFVLLSHNQKVGDVELNFYSLYMHLAEEKGAERPRFMSTKGFATHAEPGKVAPLDPAEPVQAGDVIGHVGVGPGGEPALHWEIFALSHAPVEKLDRGRFWTYYSGSGEGRFCRNAKILEHLDLVKKDGIITTAELLQAYRGDDRFWARRAVTYHPSEWSPVPDWQIELASAPEIKSLTAQRRREITAMVEEQINPTLWWHEDVVGPAGLPPYPYVFTYHPVSFLAWLNELVGSQRDLAPRKVTKADYDGATGSAQLDIDDKDGVSFVSEADLKLDDGPKLTLDELIDGYGD